MLIQINKKYCWLGKASACDIEELDTLLRELATQWSLSQFDTAQALEPPYSQLVQRCIEILPSKPGLTIALLDLKADLLAFEGLFFRADGGESLIAARHKFEPKFKRLEPKPGEAITGQHLPFPSSGNTADDQLASLLNTFEQPGLATWVWQNLSLDRIDRIIYSLNKLSTPEADRIAAYVADLAINENPELFSIEDAEKSFAEVERMINTGETEGGWKTSRQ